MHKSCQIIYPVIIKKVKSYAILFNGIEVDDKAFCDNLGIVKYNQNVFGSKKLELKAFNKKNC